MFSFHCLSDTTYPLASHPIKHTVAQQPHTPSFPPTQAKQHFQQRQLAGIMGGSKDMKWVAFGAVAVSVTAFMWYRRAAVRTALASKPLSALLSDAFDGYGIQMTRQHALPHTLTHAHN